MSIRNLFSSTDVVDRTAFARDSLSVMRLGMSQRCRPSGIACLASG